MAEMQMLIKFISPTYAFFFEREELFFDLICYDYAKNKLSLQNMQKMRPDSMLNMIGQSCLQPLGTSSMFFILNYGLYYIISVSRS